MRIALRMPGHFDQLPRNTRITLLAQPLWSVPAGLVMSFASLYMMNLGLSSQQIGLISSVSSLIKLVVAVFTSWIIDRLGRKHAQLIFDIVSWLIPYFLWATATTFDGFFLAGVFNGFVIINSVAYECFHVEDVPLSLRMVTQRFKLVSEYTYGFMPLIMGFLISRYTLVPAMRGCYWFGFVCCVFFVLSKAIFLTDTSVGIQRRREQKSVPFSFSAAMRGNLEVLRYIAGQKELAVLYTLHTMIMMARAINTLYFLPFLSQALLLSESLISWVPILTTLVSLLVTYLVIPRLGSRRHSALLAIALWALAAGGLLISFSGAAFALPMAAVNVLLWGFANACTGTILQVRIHAIIRSDIRSGVMSAFQLLSMLIMLPAGLLGGILYAHKAAFAVLLPAAIFLSAAVLYLGKIRKGWFRWSAEEMV